MATTTKTNDTGASPKEKFDAAVRVIHGLPKQGSFQPSHALMLTFYALYKQATNGPCNISKPAFYDVVGRAKWDAWNKLGSMSQEEAMIAYVEELKKIIETMPHTDNVQGFVEKLGDFYEIIDDDAINSRPETSMIINAVPRHGQQQRTAGAPAGESAVTAAAAEHGGRISPGSSSGSSDEGLNDISERQVKGVTNGLLLNGHHGHLDDEDDSNEDDDDEEFCETSDISHADHRSAPRHGTTTRDSAPAYRQEVLDQVNTAVARLQRDVDSILTRLQSLESISRSLVNDQRTLTKNNVQQSKNRWRLFPGMNRSTVIFFFAWPFIAHLIIAYMSRRNRRYRR